MIDVRAKMSNLETEINDLVTKIRPDAKAVTFQFEEYKEKYKELNYKLSDLHIELASENSGIHIEEGSRWVCEQMRKLTDLLP